MFIGPIHPIAPGQSTGHAPVKPIRVQATNGKQVILFTDTVPYALQGDVQSMVIDTVVYETTQQLALIKFHQIEELAKNAEWNRAGIFIQWREDSISDAEDGWYIFKAIDISEDIIFSAYGEPHIELELRARQKYEIGVFVDAKHQVNDSNITTDTPMAAFPGGTDLTACFPATGWTLAGSQGNIGIVENPVAVRAPITSYIDTMQKGCCHVMDETLSGT